MADLLIAGGGPAGLTAAIYALRAGKSVAIFEKDAFGGQITASPRVENYPGLPSVSGLQLADAMLGQALDLGADIELETITGAEKTDRGFTLFAGKKLFSGKALIIASGAMHRPLGVPGEEKFSGHGLSYCAVCDGAFFKGMPVAVVGGGSSAVQAASFLSDLCPQVTLIHRREGFRCERGELEALRGKKNVSFRLNARVFSLQGEASLESIVLEDAITGEQTQLPVAALFVCIGQNAQNAAFSQLVSLNEDGFILAGENCQTSVPGVFAAGDCRSKSVRQLTTATADGTVAALAACAWIDIDEK